MGNAFRRVIATCGRRVAIYKLSKEVHFVAIKEFSRSASGEIKRPVLEKRLGWVLI